MGRYARAPEGGWPELEPNNYAGRCYRIVDLGTTHDEFAGEVKARARLMISFELPDEPMPDGRPYSVTWWVTNSLHEKASLRIGLETWRRRKFTDEELKGFDLKSILGVCGMVTVAHSGSGKARAVGVGPLPKGMVCGPAVNEPMAFFIDEWDDDLWEKLPDGIKEMVRKSDEYKARRAPGTPGQQMRTDDFDDDIPFN